MNPAEFLKDGERLDDLGRNGLAVIQDPKAFCFGVDAVLLSWFAKAKPGDRVLDLCTGSGVIPILMDARNPGATYVGLEIQEESVDRAERSVQMNGLTDRIRIAKGDVKTVENLFPKATFDVVTVNPPYIPAGKGLVNPSDGKAVARHEVLCDLEDVVRAAAVMLKPGGSLYLVHRPARLSELFATLALHGLSVKDLRFVYSFADGEATLVLLSAVRGGRSENHVLPPVVIYREKGLYTDEFVRIYTE